MHVAMLTGNYTTVVTPNGYSSASSNSILVLPVSNNEDKNDMTMEIYPNPNSGSFDIKLNSNQNSDCSFEIYNSHGSQLMKYDSALVDGTFLKPIELNGALAGAYQDVFRSHETSITKKVIVTK